VASVVVEAVPSSLIVAVVVAGRRAKSSPNYSKCQRQKRRPSLGVNTIFDQQPSSFQITLRKGDSSEFSIRRREIHICETVQNQPNVKNRGIKGSRGNRCSPRIDFRSITARGSLQRHMYPRDLQPLKESLQHDRGRLIRQVPDPNRILSFR